MFAFHGKKACYANGLPLACPPRDRISTVVARYEPLTLVSRLPQQPVHSVQNVVEAESQAVGL